MISPKFSKQVFFILLGCSLAAGQSAIGMLAGKLIPESLPAIVSNETTLSAIRRTPLEPANLVTKVEGRYSFGTAMGTGWCLTRDCDWVITNYHVIKLTGGHPSVNGVKPTQITMATSEHDKGARAIPTAAGTMTYSSVRDIALLKLSEPLSGTGLHGVPFYTGDLQPGQSVVVLGYPGGKLESIGGKFVEECEAGELRFDLTREVSRGLSGGLVLDEQGRAVGLIYGISETNAKSVYAVPVWSVAEVLHGADQAVYKSVFGDAENLGEDTDSIAPSETPNPPQNRPNLSAGVVPVGVPSEGEAPTVAALRSSAQTIAKGMDNLIARQTTRFLTGGRWQHEVRLLDGVQHFRSAAGKEMLALPGTRLGPVPGSDWADLVRTVGSDPSVDLRFARDLIVAGDTIHEFRYQADAESEICRVRIERVFRKEWRGNPPCQGLIWTDEQLRILKITKDIAVPRDTGITKILVMVRFGWWEKKLVPLDMHLKSTRSDGTTQSSTVEFDNYREFQANSRILFLTALAPEETFENPPKH